MVFGGSHGVQFAHCNSDVVLTSYISGSLHCSSAVHSASLSARQVPARMNVLLSCLAAQSRHGEHVGSAFVLIPLVTLSNVRVHTAPLSNIHPLPQQPAEFFFESSSSLEQSCFPEAAQIFSAAV